MKSIKAGLRRHDNQRLKKKGSAYGCLLYAYSDRWAGRYFQTPCGCSCWMCGNQRKHHGIKFQELKALETATWEVKSYFFANRSVP